MQKVKWEDLSSSERERYINQDAVNSSELVIDFLDDFISLDVWRTNRHKMSSNQMKDLIIALRKDGKSVSEICYHLPCSHQYVYRILKRYKISN